MKASYKIFLSVCYNRVVKFKFINLNVWLGGKIWNPMIDFLKKEDPDILALQEVFNSHDPMLTPNFRTMDEFNKIFDYKYKYFDLCFIKDWEGVKTESGNAIFSKYPIVTTDSLLYDGKFGHYEEKQEDFLILPRRLQHARIDISGIEINVFNTQGIWGTDGRDNERRIKMGKAIRNRIKREKNVILSGDFNVNPDTQTIGYIEDELVNVSKNATTTSFNLKIKTAPGFDTAVVDMVFTSPNIKVLSEECPNIEISDHLPLVCEFEA